jgi:hypothetical protein
MKTFFNLQLTTAFICISLIAANAQDSVTKTKATKLDTITPSTETPAVAPTDKSLNGQYHYLLSKVYNYQQPLVGAYHKSIMDTLNQARHALRDAQTKLLAQGKTVDSLQASATSKDQSLEASNAKVNEVSLLGLSVSKSTYNLIMWGLVLIFGACAVIVMARSGAHTREAHYRTNLYNELDEEFKTYKAKANEKEKKLARDLQTERNKVEELMGRG